MAKKHWIYIKRGLSEDSKHRAAMGECVWLYMHIIDRADWETGIAYDWKDEAEAADMGMPVRTLREQRRKLDELDYITCIQRQYSQDIVIKRWIDPRNYSGKVLNQGDIPMEPRKSEQDDTQGDSQGYTQGSSQDVTPTSNSKSKSSSEGSGLSEKDIQQVNAKVDAMIANSKKVKYQNRDKIPEPYLPFADLYNELTKQEPTKRVIFDWLGAFEDWKQEGLQPEHIRAAWAYANRPEGGFPVGRPGSLTNTAVAMKSKALTQAAAKPAIDASAVVATMDMIDEKYSNKEYVPPPAWVAEKMAEIARKRGVARP
jgi:hypothetical protein